MFQYSINLTRLLLNFPDLFSFPGLNRDSLFFFICDTQYQNGFLLTAWLSYSLLLLHSPPHPEDLPAEYPPEYNLPYRNCRPHGPQTAFPTLRRWRPPIDQHADPAFLIPLQTFHVNLFSFAFFILLYGHIIIPLFCKTASVISRRFCVTFSAAVPTL